MFLVCPVDKSRFWKPVQALLITRRRTFRRPPITRERGRPGRGPGDGGHHIGQPGGQHRFVPRGCSCSPISHYCPANLPETLPFDGYQQFKIGNNF